MLYFFNFIRCEKKIPNDIEFMSKNKLRENKLHEKIKDRAF